MDQIRMSELTIRHRHSDGVWGTLEPRPIHHDPAEHDPERTWPSGRLYVCTTCDEQVLVDGPAADDPHA